MGFLIYLALGAVFGLLVINMKNIDLSMPSLYLEYLNKTGDDGLAYEGFRKWMLAGLLAAYCAFWPVILVRNIYLLIKGKKGDSDDDNIGPPSTSKA